MIKSARKHRQDGNVTNANGITLSSLRSTSGTLLDMQERHPAVPEALGRNHIEKVASSVTFSRADQLRRLFEWLGYRSLEPEPVSPSEKEIAEGVLARKDFDPQTDSLVRKEMSRLREKLLRYYQSEGLHDPIVIDAKAGYLFRFEQRGNAGWADQSSCWLVLPFRTNHEHAELGMELLEDLLMQVADRNGPELVSPATALAYRERVGDLRHFAAECRAQFVVEGSLRRRGEALEAFVWFVNGQSGRACRSCRVQAADAGQLASEIAAWLMDKSQAF